MDAPPPPRTPLWIHGALAVLVAWGLYPYRIIVDHYPWKVDAIKWVTNGASESWVRWVFATTHFVGYRPVAAGSFTLDHAIAGYTPEAYRVTDYGLHALAAVGIAQVFRRLTGSANAWMLLPAALFLAHPAVEETLPYLARRSYLLATMFGTWGLVAFLDHLRQDRTVDRNAVLATVLLTLGILSNEVAYVLLPMLPMLALHQRWTPGTPIGPVLRRCALPWAPVVPAVIARFLVLGWTGGYVRHYFVATRMGRKTLREVSSFNGGEIVAGSLEYVWMPVSFVGEDTILLRSALVVGAVAAALFWMSVVEPLLDPRDREKRTAGLLVVWLLGYALLYALSRTWFWRQGYPMVVPVALLVAWLGWDAVRRHADRPLLAIARLAPVALVALGLVWHSPMVRGMTPGPIQGRFDGNAILHEVQDALDDLQGPGQVYTVLPLNKSHTRNTNAWLSRLYGDRDLRISALANGVPAEGLARQEGNTVRLGAQARISESATRTLRIQGDVVPLDRLRTRGRPTWVLFPDGHAWTLVPVESEGR